MRSRAALDGGEEGGLKTCPMDWVVGGLLHPVPKGNTFESFVVAAQAVWLDGSGVLLLQRSGVITGSGYRG